MSRRTQRLRTAAFFSALCLLTTTASIGRAEEKAPATSEEQSVKNETEEHRFRFGLNLTGVTLSSSGGQILGFGVGLRVRHGITDKVGVIAGFEQSFDVPSFAPLYSAVTLGVTYAITGSLITRTHKTTISGMEVLDAEENSRGGFRLQAQTNIFFFNGSAIAIVFTGLGGGVSYEFPSSSSTTWDAGIRMDLINGSSTNLMVFQIYAGILF